MELLNQSNFVYQPSKVVIQAAIPSSNYILGELINSIGVFRNRKEAESDAKEKGIDAEFNSHLSACNEIEKIIISLIQHNISIEEGFIVTVSGIKYTVSSKRAFVSYKSSISKQVIVVRYSLYESSVI